MSPLPDPVDPGLGRVAPSGLAALVLPTARGAALRSRTAPDSAPSRLTPRRRVRLARRHLGSGPYLDHGGALLALLAAHGSASAFVPDPAGAEAARRAAPGCPVHTQPDAIPTGLFRGVLAVTEEPPDDAVFATWRRVLVPEGRVLLVGAPPVDVPDGFALRWTGRERWRSGAAVVVLQARPERMIGA